MTFLEYIDSAEKVGINNIPKSIAPILLALYPERFPNSANSNDSIQQAVKYCSGDTFRCDFKHGLQYSYLSLSSYDARRHSFIDAAIEWSSLEFDPIEIAEDEDIIFDDILYGDVC